MLCSKISNDFEIMTLKGHCQGHRLYHGSVRKPLMPFNNLIPEVSKVKKVTNHWAAVKKVLFPEGMACNYLAQVSGRLQLKPVTAGARSFRTVLYIRGIDETHFHPFAMLFSEIKIIWDFKKKGVTN